MKKIIFTLLFLAIIQMLSAQNVGVGETAPASKLSVKGGVSIGNGYTTTTAPADGALIKGQVGIGTTAPNAAAILDITSTTKGVLYPRMTTTERLAIANPPTGLIVMDTTNRCLMFFVGGAWQNIACGCTSAPSVPATISAAQTTLICTSPGTYVFSTPDVSGASSYNWTVTGDPSPVITGQGTSTVTIAFSTNAATAVKVAAVNVCGTSAYTSQSISFLSAPVAQGTIANLPDFVCPSAVSGIVLTAPAFTPAASSYTWSLPPGVTTSSSLTGSSITVNVSNTPGQSYVVSVTGNNCAGSSSAVTGNINVIGAPTAPTGITASSSGSSIFASWTPSTSSGSSVAGYYLDVSANSSFSSFVGSYQNYVVTTDTITITGLTCGTAYYLRLRAYDACPTPNVSAYSTTYNVSSTPHGKQIFQYAGRNQTFTVPCNVTSISVKMWAGGGGGGYFGSGGAAGYVSGNLTVTPLTAYTIIVGSGGAGGTNYNGTTAGVQGSSAFGGGGKGIKSDGGATAQGSSGGGGGISAIANSAVTTYYAIAGAGGGGGSIFSTGDPAGGPGGNTTAAAGSGADGGDTTGAYGKGGTATTNGAAGTNSATVATANKSSAGGTRTGGNGGGWNNAYGVYGGGGGAGYHGGGGGGGTNSATLTSYCGGGGGGSSYTTGFTSGAVNTGGTNTSANSFNTPPNSTDPDYITVTYTVSTLFGTTTGTAGTGGDYSPTDGTPGLVVISW